MGMMPDYPINIQQIQSDRYDWEAYNFPKDDLSRTARGAQAMMGVQEEVGELAHAFLKRWQGIRGTEGQHTAEMRDAVGDIVMYLMSLCDTEGWDLASIIRETWETIRVRDWQQYPETGLPPVVNTDDSARGWDLTSASFPDVRHR